MAWIQSHQELRTHPKTLRLARLLSVSPITAIGHLHCLWWWCLDYAQHGDLSTFDHLDIAIAAGWDGDADTFIAAMESAGFLDVDAFTITVHDWQEYGGRLIERREKNAERMRAARSDAVQNTCEPRAEHVNTRARLEKSKSREEKSKSREEETTSPRSRAADGADYPRWFEEIWEHYPRKVGKAEAFKALKRRNPDINLCRRIIVAIESQKQSHDWTKDGGDFIPHMATWVNREGWNDELRPARASPPNGKPAEPKLAPKPAFHLQHDGERL